MAYLFDDALSQHIDIASAVVTAPPFTFVALANSNDQTITQLILSVYLNSDNNYHTEMFASGAEAGDPIVMETKAGFLSTAQAKTTSGYTAGAWFHAGGVTASSSSRSVYKDGANSATDATTETPTTPDRTQIGAIGGSAPFSGDLAWVAIYNIDLSAADLNALAKGFSPELVRPDKLVFFAPLIRNLNEIRAGLALTNTGGATVSVHPRVYA